MTNVGTIERRRTGTRAQAEREMLSLVHELRGPLQGIEAFAGLLRRELAQDARLLEYVDIVLSGARDLSLSCDRVTAFAQLEATQREEVAVGEEFASVAAAALAGRDDIEVEIGVEEEARVVRADRHGIRQVFYNIVMNAAEAMEGGGKIRFEGRRQGGKVVMQLSDTGKGMSEEEARRAAGPFQSGKPGGLGLGLAIVERIARGHGGGVSIVSRVGGPTTVEVVIEDSAND